VKTHAGDASSLAWGIVQVLENPDGAKLMAETAYHKAKTVYNWQNIAKQTIGVYERIWKEYLNSSW
jgi:glycogen(starch) synthase